MDGREGTIFTERERKLEEAREKRAMKRKAVRRSKYKFDKVLENIDTALAL